MNLYVHLQPSVFDPKLVRQLVQLREGMQMQWSYMGKKSNILLEIISKVAQNIHNDETIKKEKKYQLKNNMTTTLACHDQP